MMLQLQSGTAAPVTPRGAVPTPAGATATPTTGSVTSGTSQAANGLPARALPGTGTIAPALLGTQAGSTGLGLAAPGTTGLPSNLEPAGAATTGTALLTPNAPTPQPPSSVQVRATPAGSDAATPTTATHPAAATQATADSAGSPSDAQTVKQPPDRAAYTPQTDPARPQTLGLQSDPAKEDSADTESPGTAAVAGQTVDSGTLAMLAGQTLRPQQRLEGAGATPPDDQKASALAGENRGGNQADAIRQQAADDARDAKAATAEQASSTAQGRAATESHIAYQAEASKARALLQADKAELAAQTGFLIGTETSPTLPGTSATGGTTPATTTVASPATAARHEVTTPFGQRGWDQAVSSRVLWVAQEQLQQASLTLNPPNLGPIQITVQIDNQQAVVQFVATQPEVRQALQEALPVLRDMFGQAGIELGQTNVSSGQSDQGARQQARQDGRNQDDNPSIMPLIESASLSSGSAGLGLINTFA